MTLFLTIVAGVFFGLWLWSMRWLLLAVVWVLILVIAAHVGDAPAILLAVKG